jgi:hypothetical protein
MPKEAISSTRISLLIQAYGAGLVDLTEEDKRKIALVLNHPLKS